MAGSDDESYFSRSVTSADLREILMAARISPKAKPGSLLKGERKPGAKRDKRPDYLALVRRCPCLGCDHDQKCEAAHVRYMATLQRDIKPITGIGIKPDDLWALPLCAGCHHRQHEIGEHVFWDGLGLNPLTIAMDLWGCFSIEQMRAVIFAAREMRK
jgi:hypothetical protein